MIHEALERMGTDHLDVWQMHNVRQSHLELDDVWTFLDKVKQAGTVTAVHVAAGATVEANAPLVTLQ